MEAPVRVMIRRHFLGGALGALAASGAAHELKIGMYLPELGLAFDDSLDKAHELGVKHVWFNKVEGEREIAEMSDAEADRMVDRVRRRGMEIFVLNAGNPFKGIHLEELDLKTLPDHPKFSKELGELTRSMEIAARHKIPAVGAFTFAWPGEYNASKPTWPMRWATRGGIIAKVDEDKWVKAFRIVAERAERHGVDVALSMMPWNYTNTTSNFRQLVEKTGSKRLKVMWGPADNWNSGEADVATTGFANIRPYLHGLHLKDLHVIDGANLKFDYKPLGEGDVDYGTIFRKLLEHRFEGVLSLATHFRPPSGSRVEAMQINLANLRRLLGRAATGA